MLKKYRLFYDGRAILLCCFFAFQAFCLKITQINYIDGKDSTSLYPNIEYSAEFVNAIIKEKIANFADSGYPFVEISPKISREGDNIKIDLLIERNSFVENIRPVFIIDGKLREHLAAKPIESILLQNNELYRISSIQRAQSVLQSKEYIDYAVFFSPEIKDTLSEIPIRVRAVNSVFFSGGLGFATHPQTSIVGDASLNIVNVLGFGEIIDFSYVSEDFFYAISAGLEIPYFLETPFGLLFEAQMEISDSLYGSISLLAGTKYFFKNFWEAKLFAEYGELSAQDSSSRYGGIKLAILSERQRYRRSKKSRNYNFSLKSGILYQENRMPKAEIVVNTAFHVPITVSRLAYLVKPGLGIIAFQMPETLHKTQVFQLGGANSVRGYQESIFSSLAFMSLRNEFRYYIDDFSAVYLLGDYAAFTGREYSLSEIDQIFGYGAGISVPLRRILFSFEWARHIRDFSSLGRLHFRVSNF